MPRTECWNSPIQAVTGKTRNSTTMPATNNTPSRIFTMVARRTVGGFSHDGGRLTVAEDVPRSGTAIVHRIGSFSRIPRTFSRILQTFLRIPQTFLRTSRTFLRTSRTFLGIPQTFLRISRTFLKNLPDILKNPPNILENLSDILEYLPDILENLSEILEEPSTPRHPLDAFHELLVHALLGQLDRTSVPWQDPFESIWQQPVHRFDLLAPGAPAGVSERVEPISGLVPGQMVAGEEEAVPIEKDRMSLRVAGG